MWNWGSCPLAQVARCPLRSICFSSGWFTLNLLPMYSDSVSQIIPWLTYVVLITTGTSNAVDQIFLNACHFIFYFKYLVCIFEFYWTCFLNVGAGFTSRLPTSLSTWYGVLLWKFCPCQTNSLHIWGLPSTVHKLCLIYYLLPSLRSFQYIQGCVNYLKEIWLPWIKCVYNQVMW